MKKAIKYSAVVVVVLIGLALLLLPALAKAGPSARQTKCMNNLKQIGLAAARYMAEHNTKEWPQDLLALKSYFPRSTDWMVCPEAIHNDRPNPEYMILPKEDSLSYFPILCKHHRETNYVLILHPEGYVKTY